ncbi:MAG TPA: Mth938-like domain-containing protein [Sedimentisphaerales bacterium]|nr:Mth938-like domain-containing protein [Sedimentisphaerales bacterium]
MHIDSYQFGKIVIDGVDYSSDCLILGDNVQSNWQRKRGHLLSEDDLEPVVKAKPTLLIVGCGISGMMKVPNGTRHFLLEEDIQLEALDTARAVERFNELSQTNIKIAAALHLTC